MTIRPLSMISSLDDLCPGFGASSHVHESRPRCVPVPYGSDVVPEFLPSVQILVQTWMMTPYPEVYRCPFYLPCSVSEIGNGSDSIQPISKCLFCGKEFDRAESSMQHIVKCF